LKLRDVEMPGHFLLESYEMFSPKKSAMKKNELKVDLNIKLFNNFPK